MIVSIIFNGNIRNHNSVVYTDLLYYHVMGTNKSSDSRVDYGRITPFMKIHT
jgi:hypothetical protein